MDNEMLVYGSVKWFDPVKGFGFVVAGEGVADILFHSNVLRNYGQNSVAGGERLRIKVQPKERGVQALEVLEIEPPQSFDQVALADFEDIDPEIIAAEPVEVARVKWFDKAKRFGFADVRGGRGNSDQWLRWTA